MRDGLRHLAITGLVTSGLVSGAFVLACGGGGDAGFGENWTKGDENHGVPLPSEGEGASQGGGGGIPTELLKNTPAWEKQKAGSKGQIDDGMDYGEEITKNYAVFMRDVYGLKEECPRSRYEEPTNVFADQLDGEQVPHDWGFYWEDESYGYRAAKLELDISIGVNCTKDAQAKVYLNDRFSGIVNFHKGACRCDTNPVVVHVTLDDLRSYKIPEEPGGRVKNVIRFEATTLEGEPTHVGLTRNLVWKPASIARVYAQYVRVSEED